jgi:GTPase SAR1 family protein
VTGDAYVIVYSITDRQTFQTALQFIKNIREQELLDQQVTSKRHVPIILVGNKSDLVRKRSVTKESAFEQLRMTYVLSIYRQTIFLAARHAAFKYDCKFVETSAAINDKVDDLLAGTLKQIRICEHSRNEQRRRLTVTNGSVDTNDSETAAILTSTSCRKGSTMNNRNSKNIFAKFLNVFRKKPSRLPADVENLNIGIR